MNSEIWRDVWREFSEASGGQLGWFDMHGERFSDRMATANARDEDIGCIFEAVFDRQLRMSDFPFNLCPSDRPGRCLPVAVFVALDSKTIGLRAKHRMSLSKAMQRIVQHVQGDCIGHTTHVLLIASTWNNDELAPWRSNIRNAGLTEFRILIRTSNDWAEMDGLCC